MPRASDLRGRVRRRARRTLRPARWGNLRRARPIDGQFGFGRGTPIDRYYTERFLARHRADVSGVVGEVEDDVYIRRFGSGVTRTEIIDVDAGNPAATLVADLGTPGCLPEASFDCLIVTQVLQYVPALEVAVRELVRALRPGGSLLLAVPALTPHDDYEDDDQDLWRFWPAGLRHLLAGAAPDASTTIVPYGNLRAAIAFLHGISAEELREDELAQLDRRFPVVVCARLELPAAAAGEGGRG